MSRIEFGMRPHNINKNYLSTEQYKFTALGVIGTQLQGGF